jgi:hypothetical protein
VILWLNGPFGGGKTTTARTMVANAPGMCLFDPETVGYMLLANLADRPVADFQDLPAWRMLVPRVAAVLAAEMKANLISVQTVLVERYWAELRRGLAGERIQLVHVLLDCEEAVLRQRIAGDVAERGAETWRLDHLAPYEAAKKSWLVRAADVVIDTSMLDPDEVARRVIAVIR